MPGSVRARLLQSTLVAALLALALAIAGCGGGDGGGEETDLASFAPPGTPLYVEFAIQPQGETKSSIEALARSLAGIDDLGGLVESELEQSAAEEGDEVDVESEITPWLGERAAFLFPAFEEEEFEEVALAVEVTDAGEAEDFIDEHAVSHGQADDRGSYQGVDFRIDKDDGQAVGVVDDLLVLADSEKAFKLVVDASDGDSLADEEAFSGAIANVPDGSAADVYVDIGALIKESGGTIDPETKLFLDAVGVEPEEATAVASVIPGSDQIELDVSSDLGGENPPSGDASKLLGTLPADSLAAVASPEFGKRFQEGIDKVDEEGLPGEVGPHELKQGLKQSGIDLESISSGIGDAALFVGGSSERDLEAALIMETEDPQQATNTVSNLGLFLKASGTPGVTELTGEEASGFMIRSPELGRQPVVVAAKGSYVGIGYGVLAVPSALSADGEKLADNPAYEEAVTALGGTAISGFVDGRAALKLASALVPPGEEGFREAKRYLTKIDYVAMGSAASDGLTTAKLIVGVGR